MSRQGGLPRVGSGIGMTDISSRLKGDTAGIGYAVEVAAQRNLPGSKLCPDEGADSQGTGINKDGRAVIRRGEL